MSDEMRDEKYFYFIPKQVVLQAEASSEMKSHYILYFTFSTGLEEVKSISTWMDRFSVPISGRIFTARFTSESKCAYRFKTVGAFLVGRIPLA